MSRFDQCQISGRLSDEQTASSQIMGNAGEPPQSASSRHPMTLSQCLFVVGLFLLALVFAYFVVFRIDPFAVDLYRSPSHTSSLLATSPGDRL